MFCEHRDYTIQATPDPLFGQLQAPGPVAQERPSPGPGKDDTEKAGVQPASRGRRKGRKPREDDGQLELL